MVRLSPSKTNSSAQRAMSKWKSNEGNESGQEAGLFNVQSLIEDVSPVPKTPLLWPEQLRGDHLIDRVTRGTAFKQLGYSDR
jgi:hypothetical protein